MKKSWRHKNGVNAQRVKNLETMVREADLTHARERIQEVNKQIELLKSALAGLGKEDIR